ncbi:MAG: DNA repair exonuclease [Candidatus Thermoplasmatota archaeon]|nr:DNA repair exonuclease [Candidatus Thermoplasmatota archaeon]
MKILHVADTHLGFSAYRKTTQDGINQREIDIYNAFEQFIDYAIKAKPDIIIHAGDLFDNVRPNNRAITFAINQIVKLSKNKIPIVIISGNHEHPKIIETGHIFSIFDHLENVYPIYNSKYEKIQFRIEDKKLLIHAIPQCNSKKEYDEELKKLITDKTADYNIFVSHGSVTGVKEFTMNEFNELIIPTKIFSRDFDYIALGHFHKYTKLAENAFYTGATENLTFADANEKKGFIEVILSEKSLKQKFIEINTRPMIDIKPIKCTGLKIEEIMKKIKQKVQEIKPEEKTFRITLDDIPTNVYRSIDFNEIRKLTNNAIHYEIKVNIIKKDDNKKQPISSRIDALINEFKKYIDAQNLDDKETLQELGISYIEKIQARDEGK